MLILSACTIAGCAQRRPAEAWPDAVRRLQPGTPVAVTDTVGTEVRGEVAGVSETSLTLSVAEASRQFDFKDVRQVRRDGDSLWNGLAIGVGVGLVAAGLPDDRCSGQPLRCDDKQIPERITFFVVSTAAGVGIDALKRDRRVLYVQPGRVTVRILPAFGPQLKGVSIAIGF